MSKPYDYFLITFRPFTASAEVLNVLVLLAMVIVCYVLLVTDLAYRVRHSCY
ncbi:hypothetical protein K440DRAFT_620479 [Wilcoxina mikolae CBS 423.85]|nr:hypothetical protein K440DRAFT_620479 [Wilcoxina mikolae CBS 423.85]